MASTAPPPTDDAWQVRFLDGTVERFPDSATAIRRSEETGGSVEVILAGAVY